ncbi:Holliday junction recognition protein isoform X2 [Petromyzon marinus]|uniref:Holliday junction recognition protein isoform X2 n=1 Tax=Petromyzon marinus TaxID=7757 RepID=A0AAJ7SYK2_PETMA|nr:Holliday junction recognition protein isoform X2 [Petromyzon marinus]
MDDSLHRNLQDNERRFRRRLELIFEKYSHPFEDAPIVDLDRMTYVTKFGEKKWNPDDDLEYMMHMAEQSHRKTRSEVFHNEATSIIRNQVLQMQEQNRKAMQGEDKRHAEVENVKQCQHAKEEETLRHSENPGAFDEGNNSFHEKQCLTENGMLEGSLQEQDTSAMSVEMVNLPSTPSMQHTATNHHGGQLLKCVIMEISPEGSHAPINRTGTETSPVFSDEAVPVDVSNTTIGEVYPYMLAKLSKLIAKDSSRHTKQRASHHMWRKNGHFQLAAGRARVARERKRLDAATRNYEKSLVKMWNPAEIDESDVANDCRICGVVGHVKQYIPSDLRGHSCFEKEHFTYGSMDKGCHQHDSGVTAASRPLMNVLRSDQNSPVEANTLQLCSLTFPKSMTASIPRKSIPRECTHHACSHSEQLCRPISESALPSASQSSSKKSSSVNFDQLMLSENNATTVATHSLLKDNDSVGIHEEARSFVPASALSMPNAPESAQGHRALWQLEQESTHRFASDDACVTLTDGRSYAPTLPKNRWLYPNTSVCQANAFPSSDVATETSVPRFVLPQGRNMAAVTNDALLNGVDITEYADGLWSGDEEEGRMHPRLHTREKALMPLSENVIIRYLEEEEKYVHSHPRLERVGSPQDKASRQVPSVNRNRFLYTNGPSKAATPDKRDCGDTGGSQNSASDRKHELLKRFLNPAEQARDHGRSASPSLLRHRSVPLSFPSPRSEHRHSDRAHSVRAEALAHCMSYVQTNAGGYNATRQHSPRGREREFARAARSGLDILTNIECSPVSRRLSLMSLRSPVLACRSPLPRRQSRISDFPLDSLQEIDCDHQMHPCSPIQRSWCPASGLRSPVSTKHRENIHRNLMPRKLSYSNESDSGKDSRSHHLFRSHSKPL